MNLHRMRRAFYAAPTALVTLICFLMTLVPPRIARATDDDPIGPAPIGAGGATSLATPASPANSPDTLATVNLSTGAAQTSYTFELPKARGDAQPSLSLRYNSSSGVGFAGVGWTLTMPSITRRSPSGGIPRFQDPILLAPNTLASDLGADEYTIDGDLLVPLAVLDGTSGTVITGQVGPGETFPTSVLGQAPGHWAYFRREVDDGNRYFFGNLSGTWVIQTKSGQILQLGQALDQSPLGHSGVEVTDVTTASTFGDLTTVIYRWNLVRKTDASGNTCVYVWDDQHLLIGPNIKTAGTQYLTDIYDTLQPGKTPDDMTAYAHHVRLTWSMPSQATPPQEKVPYAYSAIWKAPPIALLSQVDVSSASWLSAQRSLVRRYTLNYIANNGNTRRFLRDINLLGCPPGSMQDTPSGVSGLLTGCAFLPPTTYGYSGIADDPFHQHVATAVLKTTHNKFTIPTRASGIDNAFFVAPPSFVDLNGDAVADLVYFDGAGWTVNGVHPNTNDTLLQSRFGIFHPPAISVDLVDPQTLNPTQDSGSGPMFGDWGSTGRVDILLNWPLPRGNVAPPGPSQVFAVEIGGLTDVDPAMQLNQVPLPADDATLLASFNPNIFTSDRMFDVDGDGLPDIALAFNGLSEPGSGAASFANYHTRFTTRSRGAVTHPFGLQGPTRCTPTDYSRASPKYDPAFHSIRAAGDFDGDGLPDLIFVHDNFGKVDVLPNHGDGRFGVSASGTDCFDFEGFGNSISFGGDGLTASPNFVPEPVIRFGDLNGDGMMDIALLDTSALSICLRTMPTFGEAAWDCMRDTSIKLGVVEGSGPLDDPLVNLDLEIADLDGSGINQVIYFTGNSTVAIGTSLLVSPNGSEINGMTQPRDGLLQTISNGVGATTSFQYATAKSLGSSGLSGLPVPAWVVTQATTTNGLQGDQNVTLTSTYDYSEPIYDRHDRLFVGFKSVTETRTGVASSPGTIIKTTFATDTCAAAIFSGAPVDCADDNLIDLSGFRVTRGRPAVVEVSEQGSGTKFTTTFNEYSYRQSFVGLDGRRTASTDRVTTHTYLWDESQQGAFTTLRDTTFAPFEPITVELPTAGREIRTERAFDANLNEFLTIDYGAVGTDQPIVQLRQWALPPGDTTGWNFRVQQTKTGYAPPPDPSPGFHPITGPADPIREYDYVYDALGRLKEVDAVLSGTQSLPGASAQSRPGSLPRDASSDTPKLALRSMDYDSFGNVTRIGTSINACATTLVYDPLFFQFPQSSTAHLASCTDAGLTTSTIFDRGLGVLRQSMSPAGQLTNQTFDVFGRLTEIDAPHPLLLGGVAPIFIAQYDDTGPVRRVHTFIVDRFDSSGQTISTNHYRYVDGLGEVRAALDQAGSPSTAPQWTLSGVHASFPNGRIDKAFQAAFSTDGPDAVAPGAMPQQSSLPPPFQSFVYDGLGRVLTSNDFLGLPTRFAYHTAALSVDMTDPEQNTVGGSHFGSFTTMTRDGHGRVAQSRQHLVHGPTGPGDLITSPVYQATGEPLSITQTFPGSSGTGTNSVTRTMQYDSLGRMVKNTEPNVGTWTYAYNGEGDLVGTADARGCGQNIFHDALGRLVAKDYVPCGAAGQSAYSSPTLGANNLPTGPGTEEFYIYDSPPGFLTATFDLAEQSTYQYDARGRVSQVDRRIAAPTTTGSAPPPGTSGLSIFGTIVDAQGKPMAGLTIQLTGGLQSTTQTDANGQYVFPNLISQRSYTVQPANLTNCTFIQHTNANLNGVTTNQNASFMGTGSGCGGTPSSTPVAPTGSSAISGVISTPS